MDLLSLGIPSGNVNSGEGATASYIQGVKFMPEVWIPPRMQTLTEGKQQVQVEGSTVRQVVNNLERRYRETESDYEP